VGRSSPVEREPWPLQKAQEDGCYSIGGPTDLREIAPKADLILIAVPTLSVGRILKSSPTFIAAMW